MNIKYQPGLFLNERYFLNDKVFSRELTENERWYQGAEDRLEYFFKHEYNTFTRGGFQSPYALVENQTKFWKNVSGDVPRIHSGLPALITQGMVTLITGPGYEYSVTKGKVTAGEEGPEDSDKEKDILDEILDDNDFESLHEQAVATASWAGYTAFKISHDTELSEYPILEVVNPKNVEIERTRNRLTKVIFKQRQNTEGDYKRVTEIHEIYTKEGDKVVVNYEAYLYEENKEPVLTNLPAEYAELDRPELNFFPCVIVNNTARNSRFPGAPVGQSDYTSSQGLFHMLDDLISQSELEVANAQAMKFVNEKLIQKDADGKSYKFDKNKTTQEVSSRDMDDAAFDLKKFISILQSDIRVEKYEKTIKETTARAINNTGLSPITLGLPGFEAINSSDKSQREREKISLRTRKRKLRIWRMGMIELFEKILKYNDYMNGRIIDVYNVELSFNDYAVPTLDDQIETITKAIAGRAMSIEEAVNKLYPDKSDEDKAHLVLRIKIENGIPLIEGELEDGTATG